MHQEKIPNTRARLKWLVIMSVIVFVSAYFLDSNARQAEIEKEKKARRDEQIRVLENRIFNSEEIEKLFKKMEKLEIESFPLANAPGSLRDSLYCEQNLAPIRLTGGSEPFYRLDESHHSGFIESQDSFFWKNWIDSWRWNQRRIESKRLIFLACLEARFKGELSSSSHKAIEMAFDKKLITLREAVHSVQVIFIAHKLHRVVFEPKDAFDTSDVLNLGPFERHLLGELRDPKRILLKFHFSKRFHEKLSLEMKRRSTGPLSSSWLLFGGQ